MSTQTTLELTEEVTEVAVTGDTISVTITDDITEVQAYTLAIPIDTPGQLAAANVTVVPYNTITSNTLQSALEELADQNFRGTSTPSSNIQEGDTWYDTDDDQFKVYRETSSGNFAWVPIMVGNISPDSDTIDAGSY
tara:strand:- start:2931 stop:3341 length:411 start_codon:yes stop_codon:yes gene_type:complete